VNALRYAWRLFQMFSFVPYVPEGNKGCIATFRCRTLQTKGGREPDVPKPIRAFKALTPRSPRRGAFIAETRRPSARACAMGVGAVPFCGKQLLLAVMKGRDIGNIKREVSQIE